MSRATKRFKEYSPAQRVGVLLLAAVELAMLAAAQVDIQRRPPDQVHGRKWLWRLVCLINIVGPAIYFRWGRRAGSPPSPDEPLRFG